MDADTLRKYGFDLSTGHVYRDHKLYGTFTVSQGVTYVHLNDEGRARLEELMEPETPAPTAEPKKPAAKKSAKKAEAVLVESDPETVGSLLDSLGDVLN